MARKMKDSGIEWIGEIPEGWEVVPVKRLCTMQAGKNLTSEQIAPEGTYPVYGGNGIRGYFSDYNCDGQFLTVGRQGALCGNVHKINGKIWATEHAVITTPSSYTILDFLYYLLIGMDLNQYISSTAAQPGLAVGTLLNLKTCYPCSTLEQTQISNYLNAKCTEIDTMLSKTRSSIEEYKKLKQAVITQAVTKGVRGEREMKDSGVKWIGEIPKEWVIQKIKSISSRINVGVVIRPSEYFDENGTVPFLRGINVKEYLISSDNMVYINESSNRILSKSQVHTDDILIVRDGSIGTSCVVPAEFDGANVVSMVIATPSISCDSRFICYSLNSDVGKTQFTLTKIGSALTHTSVSAVSDIIIAVPSCAEQKEIADYLDAKCVEIDGLIAKKEQLVKELESYKKSLIYEVVTGKREV